MTGNHRDPVPAQLADSGSGKRRADKKLPRKASESRMLREDVAAMISSTRRVIGKEADELAHDIITVVRERVLQEIESYARTNIR